MNVTVFIVRVWGEQYREKQILCISLCGVRVCLLAFYRYFG